MPIDEEVPLPPSAMARLTSGDGVFTCGLSVNEVALLAERAITPVGVVIGTTMEPVGLHPQRWNQSVELAMLTEVMRTGRTVALGRMQAEADALDAVGVVGVALQLIRHEGAGDVVEFLATGTAVAGGVGDLRTPDGKPFTSELSGQDTWSLLGAGRAPVGAVTGVCVYHVAHQAMRAGMPAFAELPPYSQALYDARELAMTRLQSAAAGLAADGVLGVRLETSSRVWGPHAVEVVATGTAVRAHTTPGAKAMPGPSRVLPVVP